MNSIGRVRKYIRCVGYYRYLVELRKNQWLKTSEIEKIQQKKLRCIINHAYHNVPFYHQLFDSVGVKPDDIKIVEDLSKIPIITKSQIQCAGDEIIAKGVDVNRCEKLCTSGSTGTPLDIVYYKEDLGLLSMVRERTLFENGRRFRDRIVRITNRAYSQEKSKSLLQHIGIRREEHLYVYDSISDQIQLMKRIKPDILIGYPSSIKLLAMAVQEKDNREVHPRLIFSFAELLDTDTRNFINSVFGVTMFDYYSSMEAGVMAWECKELSGYHMNIDSVVMEFVDENSERVSTGERGKVVVTNLHSYAMPIIRYEIGDIGVFRGEECPCGRGLPLMDMIEGRSDDFVKLPDGRIFSPRAFTALMKPFSGMVANFRIIQKTEDRFTVEVVKGMNFSDDIICQIEEKFKEVFGEEIWIEPKIVKEIAREKSGKCRAVISKL